MKHEVISVDLMEQKPVKKLKGLDLAIQRAQISSLKKQLSETCCDPNYVLILEHAIDLSKIGK